MKRLLLAFAAIAGMTLGLNAKSGWDLSVGYGGYTQMDATDMHDDWHGVNTAWGALTVGLNYHINNKLSVGPSYTFSSTTTKGGHNHSNIAYHVIMLNLRYNYYRAGIFNIYAHGGLGADISHMQPKGGDSYNKGYFAFQISPIGAEFNVTRGLNMYGELGFGAQGLLQVGFRLNL